MTTNNLKTWTQELRTTPLVQVRGHLLEIDRYTDIVQGACCLGVGCLVAGLDRHNDEFDSRDSLPPQEFMTWIGATEIGDCDPYPDAGDLLDRDGRPLRYMTAVTMNDSFKFTFAQIADVFDYFGVI